MFALRTIISAMRNSNLGGGVASLSLADQYWSSVALLVNADGINATANNTFFDSSSNNFAITRTGTPAQGSISPFNDGWAGNFNGSSTGLSIASSAIFNLSASDFTAEAWIYPKAIGTAMTVFHGGQTPDWKLDITTTGAVNYLAAGSTARITSTALITVNTWSHLAVVKSGSTTTLYVNGIAAGTTATAPTNASSALYIGYYYANVAGGSQAWFNGYISNFRLVKGTAVYASSFSPPTSALTAIPNTAVLCLQNNYIKDNSTNKFPIIAVTSNPAGGTAASLCYILPVNPFSQWNTNYWSGAFNGTSNYLSVPASTAFSLGTSDFTIECWVKFSKLTGFQCILNTRYSSVGGIAAPFLIYANGSNISFYSSSNGSSHDIANAVPILSSAVLGTWYHLAITRSGNTFKTFANGVQTSTFTSVASLFAATSDPVNIGANANNTEIFGGLISNMRIVKGTALYTAAFTPPADKLVAVANTALLTCQDSTFIDKSPNNFTITATGAIPYNVGPFQNSSGVPVYSSAINGGSTYFNGAQSLNIASNASFGMGTGNFTIECWIYSPTITASASLISLRTSAANTASANALAIGYGGASKIAWSNGTTWTGGTTTMYANTWNHVAVSKQGTTVRLFVNGNLDATITDSTDLGSSRPVAIGSFEGTSGFFTGYISNIRIVKGTALYTAAFTPSTAPLGIVSGTSLLLSNSTVPVIDSACKSNITTIGSAQISTSTFKYGTGAVKFNGTSDYLTLADSSGVLTLGANNFTAECWYNPTSTASAGTLFFLNGSAGTYAAMRLDVNAAGKLQLLCTTTTGSWTVNAISSLTLATATWYHIAVVRNGTSVIAYLNGAVAASGTLSGVAYNGGSNIIGFALGTAFYLNGYVDDLRITPGVARYTAAFAAPTVALPNHG